MTRLLELPAYPHDLKIEWMMAVWCMLNHASLEEQDLGQLLGQVIFTGLTIAIKSHPI